MIFEWLKSLLQKGQFELPYNKEYFNEYKNDDHPPCIVCNTFNYRHHMVITRNGFRCLTCKDQPMNIEEIEQALKDATKEGLTEIVQDIPEQKFKLTKAGIKRAEKLMRKAGINPEDVKNMSLQEYLERLGI